MRVWPVSSSLAALAAVLVLAGPMAAASTVVFDQSTYDVTAASRNSNTMTNGNPLTGTGSTQQIADDFMLAGAGLQVNQVHLWFVYQFDILPAGGSQPLILRIWDDVGGLPGSIVYEETVTILPTATGDLNVDSRMIQFAEISLTTPFVPDAGVRYWLNPMGDDDDVTWGWQFSDQNNGERRSRGGNALDPLAWRPFDGDLAFALLVPEPSGALLVGIGGLLFVMRRCRR